MRIYIVQGHKAAVGRSAVRTRGRTSSGTGSSDLPAYISVS